MGTIKKSSFIVLFVAIAAYATVVIAGAPLKGVDVKLGKSPGGSPVAKVTTDDEGKFTFTNLEVGTYEIYCSYEECAKAINTNGHGATVRQYNNKSLEYVVTLLSNDNDVAFAAGPRQTTSQDGSFSHGNSRITATQNSQSLRTAITSESNPKTPLAIVTISGKKHEFTGHVTLMK